MTPDEREDLIQKTRHAAIPFIIIEPHPDGKRLVTQYFDLTKQHMGYEWWTEAELATGPNPPPTARVWTVAHLLPILEKAHATGQILLVWLPPADGSV
jgi:hypothetical protein